MGFRPLGISNVAQRAKRLSGVAAGCSSSFLNVNSLKVSPFLQKIVLRKYHDCERNPVAIVYASVSSANTCEGEQILDETLDEWDLKLLETRNRALEVTSWSIISFYLEMFSYHPVSSEISQAISNILNFVHNDERCMFLIRLFRSVKMSGTVSMLRMASSQSNDSLPWNHGLHETEGGRRMREGLCTGRRSWRYFGSSPISKKLLLHVQSAYWCQLANDNLSQSHTSAFISRTHKWTAKSDCVSFMSQRFQEIPATALAIGVLAVCLIAWQVFPLLIWCSNTNCSTLPIPRNPARMSLGCPTTVFFHLALTLSTSQLTTQLPTGKLPAPSAHSNLSHHLQAQPIRPSQNRFASTCTPKANFQLTGLALPSCY